MAPALRLRLRDAWLADASAEHASVASFARFALELMAVGAPGGLVAAAHRAALDEIRQAEVCFAIAGRYDASSDPGATPFAPGPLSLDGVVTRTDLAVVAAAALEEACIGETFSAMALARASASCTDPHVRVVLARIGADEARHAELGWRFVGWASAHGETRVRAEVAAAFERSLARFAQDDDHPLDTRHADDGAWRSAGRLTPDDLCALRSEVHQVVAATVATLALASRAS